MRTRPSTAARRAVAAAVAAAVLWLGACSDGQDPGFDQRIDVGDEPRPSSNTLPQCPDGGPDATTPTAGCIGSDGAVVRP